MAATDLRYSAFHFEAANTDMYFRMFQDFEGEARAMLGKGLDDEVRGQTPSGQQTYFVTEIRYEF